LADTELLKLLLPEFLVDYFEVSTFQKEGDKLHLYFEEKNVVPHGYSNQKLISKGFFDEIIIQDFPIRGQYAFLHIKRRRWLDTTSKKVVFRNWDQVAQGTRMTADFAAFLKEISRF
jgi:hypothetical protein